MSQSEPSVNAATRCCAIFGSPIRHSASPAMHNAAFAALGLNWRYLAFEVQPKNLREAIVGAKTTGFIGINLTVPHKLLALEIVDVLDESAKKWGAVNTIRFEGRADNGVWLPLRQFNDTAPLDVRANGFNTDADGFVLSLQQDLKMKLPGAKILLLGAGGAGRVAALKLAAEGAAELFLVNRTQARAEVIANEIKKQFPPTRVEIGYPGTDVDLIVNATSLGMDAGDAPPLDEKQFSLKQARAVYDMIYCPAETKLLAAAKKSGCKTANGLGMLLHQGARAFEIWTGKAAPLDLMRRVAGQSIYGH